MHVDVAAQQVGRSRRTLYYWMAAGKLPFTTSNGSRHVRLEDVRTLNIRRRHMADDPKDTETPAAEQVSDDATGATTEPTPADESETKPETTIE